MLIEILRKCIHEKDWSRIVMSFHPREIAESLSFEEGLKFAYSMLVDDIMNDDTRVFVINVIEMIRERYQCQWSTSWKFEAFLGGLYSLLYEEQAYEKKYQAIKKACERAPFPYPPELLISLASCCEDPGMHHINERQAIAYLEESVKDYLYVDAVIHLRGLYRSIGNKEKEEFWDHTYEKIKFTNVQSPSFEPDFLTNCL